MSLIVPIPQPTSALNIFQLNQPLYRQRTTVIDIWTYTLPYHQ